MVNKQRQIEINTEKNKKKKRSTTTLTRRKEMKKESSIQSINQANGE